MLLSTCILMHFLSHGELCWRDRTSTLERYCWKKSCITGSVVSVSHHGHPVLCIHRWLGMGFLKRIYSMQISYSGIRLVKSWCVNITMYTRWTHHSCTCSGNSHEKMSHQICMPFRVQNMTFLCHFEMTGFAIAPGLCLGAQCFTFSCGHWALLGSFLFVSLSNQGLVFFGTFEDSENWKLQSHWHSGCLRSFFLGSHGCNRPPKRLNMVHD